MENYKTSPLVSIIIVNYNGEKFLKKCLSSIKRQTYSDFEIIIVDNGSTDGSVKFVKREYLGSVRLIENSQNLGFGKGNNQGIMISKGEYVALLNNDTEVEPNWLSELVKVAQSDKRIGMCASKIILGDNQAQIDAAGHLIYPDGLNRGRGHREKDVGQYDIKEEVLFPSACAAIYSRDMLDEIGLFDEDFFAYGDDTDIGIRARLMGWKCIYVPTAVVYHYHSATLGNYAPLKAYLVERNRVWVLLKYFPFSTIIVSPYFTLQRLILQAYGSIMNIGAAGKFSEEFSKKQLLLILIRAYISAFGGLRKVLRQRREIMRRRKVSNIDFRKWLSEFRISARELALKE